MDDDVELRLRSAFAASARLVDDGVSAPAGVTELAADDRRRRGGWRAPRLVAAVVGVVLVGGVAVGATLAVGHHDRVGAPVLSTPLTSSSGSVGVAVPPFSGSPRTGPATPQFGVAYPFDLYTHCGIDFAMFGGWYWQAIIALPDPRRTPDAHGVTTYTGYVSGLMTLVDQDTVQFVVHDPTVDINGQVVRFRSRSTQPPPCD